MMQIRKRESYFETPSAADEWGALETPVVLCVYNRPELTEHVLEVLRKVRPTHILVVADGPKSDDPHERRKCDEVRGMIEAIDWPTQIQWNVSPSNLGCRARIQTGLSWAFSLIEEAIVLEDDCVPDASFFEFCRLLL